jgi:hypothetical protein
MEFLVPLITKAGWNQPKDAQQATRANLRLRFFLTTVSGNREPNLSAWKTANNQVETKVVRGDI